MINIRKSLSLVCDYEINEQIISNFNANIELDTGEYSMYNSVFDQKVYRANRDTVDSAYREFQDEVYKIVDEVALEAN